MTMVNIKPLTATWITDDGHFEFTFTLAENGQGLGELFLTLCAVKGRGAYRFTLLDAINLPVDGELFFDETINEFNIDGALILQCFTRADDFQYVVSGRFNEYVGKPVAEFEGTIFVESSLWPPATGQLQPVEPPLPVPIPDPPNEIPIDDTHLPYIFESRTADLFPYTYMRSWPEPDESELDLFVVSFPYTKNSHYTAWSQASSKAQRSSLEAQVKNFIESDQAYIENVEDLGAPFKQMLKLWPDLAHEPCANPVELLAQALELTTQQLETLLTSGAYLHQLENIWISYLANIVKTGYKMRNTEVFTRVLLFDHMLRYLINADPDPVINTAVQQALFRAFIALPAPLFPLPPYRLSPPATDPNDWLEVYAIGELQLVRQRLIRYQTGEVAEVVNVMPGEKRKQNIRNTERQTTITRAEDVEKGTRSRDLLENQKELVREISKTIAGFTDSYNYESLKANYGPPTNVTTDGKWSLQKTAGDPSRHTVSKFARTVMETSADLIENQIATIRETQLQHEREEMRLSTLNNYAGVEPLLGVYRWLNKIYQAEVINYGQRLILSFSISNPAEPMTDDTCFGGIGIPPESLEQKGIVTYLDISADLLPALVSYYGVFDLPPVPPTTVQATSTVVADGVRTIAIPEGYSATSAYVTYALDPGLSVNLVIGRKVLTIDHPASNSMPVTLSGETSNLPVSVTSNQTLASPPATPGVFSLSIEVTCTASSAITRAWQYRVYASLSEAYQRLLAQYAERHNPATGSAPDNPEMLRKQVFRQVKRKCLQILQDRTARTQAQLPQGSPPTQYGVNKPRYRQFFEMAIEWDELSYFIDEDNSVTTTGPARQPAFEGLYPDFFDEFRLAEVVRVFVPVRPHCSHSMLFFIGNTNIWTGEDALAPVVQGQIPEKIELTKIDPDHTDPEQLIDGWEVTIPTSMNLLTNDLIIEESL